jgi:hypothetical protein
MFRRWLESRDNKPYNSFGNARYAVSPRLCVFGLEGMKKLRKVRRLPTTPEGN